jgi:hypothetical protein
MARKIAQLIAALIAVAAVSTAAARDRDDLKTPRTPWQSLSREQQRALKPVAPEWDTMPGYQQQRLMGAARQYPNMQPIQKERFEERVRDWSQMSPEQRKAARETFQGLRKLPPEKQHELRQRWLREHGGESAGAPGEYPRERGPSPPDYSRAR